jgi:hypothetical protein
LLPEKIEGGMLKNQLDMVGEHSYEFIFKEEREIIVNENAQ